MLTSAVLAFTLHAPGFSLGFQQKHNGFNFWLLFYCLLLPLLLMPKWGKCRFLPPVAADALPPSRCCISAAVIFRASYLLCILQSHATRLTPASFCSCWCTQSLLRSAPVPAESATEVSILTPSLRLVLHYQTLWAARQQGEEPCSAAQTEKSYIFPVISSPQPIE